MPLTVRATTAGAQFTKDGPSIPLELLRTLEDGRLVIFCGAGISRHCGLPDFRMLVDDIAAHLGRPMEPDEQELFNSHAYDAALGLIEHRVGKQRLRLTVSEILDLKPGADLGTYEALLQLATSKQGHIRLVTTNFDRGFELARCAVTRTFDYAPYLPLPGTTWNSIVHLHGGLGAKPDDKQSLIVTSADFGRAYLTEGWAARFLAELFRRSGAILFVGYSVSDPAIRYIVDAFAADRANEGGHTAQAYILSGSTPENATKDQRTWRSRGLEPLTYDEREHHRLLHETLRSCAKRYRLGLFDRTSIIHEFGSHNPSAAPDPEAVSQITWALQDATGHTGRQFARLDPAPPIEWLNVLTNEGLLSIASSQQAVSAVSWLPASSGTASLHPVTEALCRWLVRKLAERELVSWVIRQGSHLHPDFARLSRERLVDTTATPLPRGVEAIWRFLSAPFAPVHAEHLSHQIPFHYQALDTHAWDPLVHDLVRLWLTPTIRFKDPFPLDITEFDPNYVASYATIELAPAAGKRSWDIAEKLLGRPDVGRIAHDLLGELTDLLHRGLTYLEFLGQINSEDDGTFSSRPSIDDHAQNTRFREWTVYIHLLREAWNGVGRSQPARSRAEVTRWMQLPFPLFRRFVLWSAGKTGGLSATESVEYLGAQSASTLWGLDTRRELLQYLRRIAPLLSANDAENLCNLVLTGPPRARYKADLTADGFQDIADRAISLRLLKLRENGAALPGCAQERLDQITRRHPEWPGATTERDEFAIWSGPAEWIGPYHFEQHLSDYLDWADERVQSDLLSPADPDTLKRWRGLLVADPQRAARVLETLGGSNAFNIGVWALALNHLAGEQTLAACVRLYAASSPHLGPAFLAEHLQTLTGIIDRYSREKSREYDAALWELWDLLIGPAEEVLLSDDADAVFSALNSPMGNLTDALLVTLVEQNPSTYDEMTQGTRARLERLLNGARPAHRHARILLARATSWLYRLKPELIVPSFLARFDWAVSPEAREMWLGYLMSPGLTPEFWLALRPLLLNAVPRSAELGDSEEQFYAFFAFILLKPDIPLEATDARRALQQGTPAGRSHVAWHWSQHGDSAADHGATLYRERLKDLLTTVWPLEQELREEASSGSLARLAIECGTEFPDAAATITPLLTTVSEPHDVLWALKDKDYAEQYPEPTLMLIDALVGERIEPWGWPVLRALLTRLTNARPALIDDPRVRRLDVLLHRFD